MTLKNALIVVFTAIVVIGCTQNTNPKNSELQEVVVTGSKSTDDANYYPAPSPEPAPVAPASAPNASRPDVSVEQVLGKVTAARGTAANRSRQEAEFSSRRPMPQGDIYHPPIQPPTDRENYVEIKENPVKLVAHNPVSTFSIDVDTGSYSNVRRMLNEGRMPPHDAVRVEEMINYFSYSYPQPRGRQPFSVVTELAPSPWNADTQLLHVGIQGIKFDQDERPAANLVFLVDVSGSMNNPNKIGLLKSSLKLLAKNMRDDDRIAIAVYAGAAGTVLESTSDERKILRSLNKLRAGGSTNGAAGIQLAYEIAEENFIEDGINRVMLATDGDFNVGMTNFDQLIKLVEKQRKNGVSLTTLGFGGGNYNDHLMEQLADAGNGNHAYIDTLKEANKVLVEQMGATLQTIAKDVKIQLEFNPAQVSQYRLIGYENRVLRNQDFNNDKIDAGEIGAGHTVTALYEIVLADSNGGWVEPLKYQTNKNNDNLSGELAELRIRYKQPDSDSSELILQALNSKDIMQDLDDSSENFRFSAAVAGFGQVLRGGDMLEEFNYDEALDLARSARGNDDHGYRGEFLTLVSLASSLEE